MAILAASGVAAANTGVVADNATAPYSMDESIERLTHSQDSRAKTVYFEDPYAGICPQTTSFLYSFSDKIVLMTPMFLVSPYSRQGEEVESAEFVFANAKCRYVISMTKFVTKDGIESQLPLYRSTQLHDLIAKLTHLGAKPASGANSGLGGDDKTKENAPIVTEEGGHAIVHPDRIDPKGAGMSFAGISFENADSSKEFPGMIYFGPQSFTMYVVNALAYQLASHVDSSKKAYDIEVIGPGSRLNFSIRKEVLESGWTAVFGK